jgi:zinc transport system substrate-binding protein
LVVLGFAAWIAGCSETGEPSSASRNKPTVVSSIYPLAELTRALVGESAEVTVMLPPGQSPHGYEPDARAMSRLSDAQLVVAVGMGLDPWADQAAAASGGQAEVFIMAKHLDSSTSDQDHDRHDHQHGAHGDHEHDHDHADKPGQIPSDHGHNHADHDHDHGHTHEHGDPHLWLDPVLVRQAIGPLANALAEAMPQQRQSIDQNAAALQDRLHQLDADFSQALTPYRGRAIITYHSAFNRLAERYGLQVATTLTPVESVGSLTAGRLNQTLTAIREHDVQVIFAEPQFPADVVDLLSEEYGVQVMILDPLGDPHSPDRAGYFAMMRYNLNTLVAGLSRSEH